MADEDKVIYRCYKGLTFGEDRYNTFRNDFFKDEVDEPDYVPDVRPAPVLVGVASISSISKKRNTVVNTYNDHCDYVGDERVDFSFYNRPYGY